MSTRRYLITSAQNNTPVHKGFWRNLMTLALHYDATIMVGTYTYNKAAIGGKGAKRGTEEGQDELWWDPKVLPYIRDGRLALAQGLDWCGEMQILPTATDPLSAMDGYSGDRSSIFPHAKVAMRSVACGDTAKFLYTTGTATLPNYIQKKAGLKATFHHSIGCLLVEVDGEHWWVRQVLAEEDGTLRDLGVCVYKGEVTAEGSRVEAIVWGDIHAAQLDPVVREAAWGEGGMLDMLMPCHQFLHDVFDGRAVAKHERKGKNHHELYKRFLRDELNMEYEVRSTQAVIDGMLRPSCKTVVVNSNHDTMLYHWLQHTNHRKDLTNAEFYLSLELDIHRYIRARGRLPLVLDRVLTGGMGIDGVKFLYEDESFIVCPDAGGGIECGMHGHRGLNGAKGNLKSFARMGTKSVVGHSHSAGIFEGCYQVGTSGLLRPGYNSGPSSWSHTHCVIYPNGKRTLIHMKNGRWRA